VDKRIQEDNLQHLALFSEYGRLALGEDECVDKVAGEVVEGAGGVLNTEEEVSCASIAPAPSMTHSGQKSSTASRKNDPGKPLIFVTVIVLLFVKWACPPRPVRPGSRSKGHKSRQLHNVDASYTCFRMEFLVRDWQNFDRDWEESVQEGACEVLTTVVHDCIINSVQESLFKEYHHEMMRYFTTVIKDRGIDDLQVRIRIKLQSRGDSIF
jgi:hypothetical protein